MPCHGLKSAVAAREQPYSGPLLGRAHSDAARLVIWALTLAVTVAGALAGAGPVTATVFGEHTGTVPRDGVAAFLVLFPVALLNCALRRMHATRAASPVRRAARRGLPRHRLSE